LAPLGVVLFVSAIIKKMDDEIALEAAAALVHRWER
jgi:hypothetical protein